MATEDDLPVAVVARMVKAVMAEGEDKVVGVTKDARLAAVKASTVFIQYLTNVANTCCQTAGRSALSGDDVKSALELIQMGDMVPRLAPFEAEFEKAEQQEKEKRKEAQRRRLANLSAEEKAKLEERKQKKRQREEEALQKEVDAWIKMAEAEQAAEEKKKKRLAGYQRRKEAKRIKVMEETAKQLEEKNEEGKGEKVEEPRLDEGAGRAMAIGNTPPDSESTVLDPAVLQYMNALHQPDDIVFDKE